MRITEKQFGVIYHTKRAIKFNKFHLIFKYTYIWCPLLIFIYLWYPSLWIFPIVGIVSLVSWLISVKMRSLSNINHYTAKILRMEYFKEMFR